MTYGPPTSPPPSQVPRQAYSTYIIDCMYQYTYVWPAQGSPFWFYPTRVEYGEVSGYRWNGFDWVFYGLDPRYIARVECYPTPTLY